MPRTAPAHPTPPAPPSPLAYSYLRFSSAQQAEGDSLRRQTERAADYCQRHHLTLDTSLTLHDLGVSAARGQNAAVGNFRMFLDAVKGGRVPEGSVLIVESFDRISRQGIDEGYDLIKGILKAGVRIVTLVPERVFDRDAVRGLSRGALEIQLILERAAEESVMKSDRIGRAWQQKKLRAAAGELMTRTVPAWIRVTPAGRMELIPERAAVVRRICREAIAGFGSKLIARRLTRDGIPPFNPRAKSWYGDAVAWILQSRATMGEYQPRSEKKVGQVVVGQAGEAGEAGKAGQAGERRGAAGSAVPNYYPAAVTEKTWYAVRAAVGLRGKVPAGRPGRAANVLAGLMSDARDGSSVVCTTKAGKRMLVSLWGTQGREGSRYVSFPQVPFERVILDALEELDESEIIPAEGQGGGRDTAEDEMSVRGELDKVRAQLARVEGEADENPDVKSLVGSLRRLEAKEAELIGQLEAVRRTAAATPLRGAWAEYKSVAKLLEEAEERGGEEAAETRARVRAALQRIVERVWCVFAGVGDCNRDRLAVVQVWFHGGGHREYGIFYTSRVRGACERDEEVRKEAFRVDRRPVGWLDLRGPEKAARFVEMLDKVARGGDEVRGREFGPWLAVVRRLVQRKSQVGREAA